MRDSLLSSTVDRESDDVRRRRITIALAEAYLGDAAPTATGATIIMPWGEAIYIPRRAKPEKPNA